MIRNIFINSLVSYCSSTLRNLNIILNSFNIGYNDIFNAKRIKLKCCSVFYDNWKVNLIKELLHFKDFNEFSVLNQNETDIMLAVICCD